MLNDQFYISKLIAGYLQGELSDEQQIEFNAWVAASPENSDYLQEEFGDDEKIHDLLTRFNSVDENSLWELTLNKLQVSKDIDKENKIKKLYPKYYKIAVVAAVLIIGAFALMLVKFRGRDEPGIFSVNDSRDIPGGKNGATLTLADGRKINLSDIAKGKLAEESGMSITKSASGQVVYSIANGAQSNVIANDMQFRKQSNTLSTSNGQQYQLILPDQTKVWLNAASSITYPASFAGAKTRNVEITGEVYFEVAKLLRGNKVSSLRGSQVPSLQGSQVSSLRGGTPKQSNQRVPFFVTTKNQTVEVLGTHFNVNAYSDEPSTKTTLLEGRVAVSFSPSLRGGTPKQSTSQAEIASQARNDGKETLNTGKGVVLKPGEQSVLLRNGAINVSPVNTENIVSWKNGDFVLKDTDFKVLMRKIARWYDVDVVYDPSAPSSLKLVGVVSRAKNISAILKILEATGEVHFEIEGRRVTVTK